MTILVRPASGADRATCEMLLGELTAAVEGAPSGRGGDLFAGVFGELIDGQRGLILLAEDADRVLGMATVSFNLALRYGGEYCQLEELIVLPEARGQNVGGLLIEATIAAARERGCCEYGLYLVQNTEKNLPFYEKYGFVRVGSELRKVLTE